MIQPVSSKTCDRCRPRSPLAIVPIRSDQARVAQSRATSSPLGQHTGPRGPIGAITPPKHLWPALLTHPPTGLLSQQYPEGVP